MITRVDIFSYVKKTYDIETDYPWKRTPNYAILRHKKNHKWFVAIVDITEDKFGIESKLLVDAINLKCDPQLIETLRDVPGIFPGYHMNKEHWITIVLNSSVPKENLFSLIDLSYELTM